MHGRTTAAHPALTLAHASRQGALRSLLCASLVPALAALLLACESTQPASNFSAAVSRYEEGRFEAALDAGQAVSRSDDSTLASQGALVAGMSAFKLGRTDQAERLAQKACDSPELETSGGGWVLMGDVRLAQHRPGDAAACFERASSKLNGADADRARDCAARARALCAPAPGPAAPTTKAPAVAQASPAVAAAKAPPAASAQAAAKPQPAAKAQAASPAAAREFTIRAGSYQTADAARKRAASLAADLRRCKAPQARVDPVTTARGDSLFAVRIGGWPTRAEAQRVLNAIGRRDLMVGAVDAD